MANRLQRFVVMVPPQLEVKKPTRSKHKLFDSRRSKSTRLLAFLTALAIASLLATVMLRKEWSQGDVVTSVGRGTTKAREEIPSVSIPDLYRDKVRLVVYILCRNEEDILLYTLRHYARFADKIVVLDNNSTDSSHDIINRFKQQLQEVNGARLELRILDTNNSYPQQFLTQWKRTKWKEARGSFDWAIVVDTDELVHFDACNKSSSIKQFLWEHQHEADVIAPVGYDMFFEEFPLKDNTKSNVLLPEVAWKGVNSTAIADSAFRPYSKPCIIQVNKVQHHIYIYIHI